jgi:hypothetical protein
MQAAGPPAVFGGGTGGSAKTWVGDSGFFGMMFAKTSIEMRKTTPTAATGAIGAFCRSGGGQSAAIAGWA